LDLCFTNTTWPVANGLIRGRGKGFRTRHGCGLEVFGTHTLRHSYRSWLDAVGTTIAVQQKLMRHADIRTTMTFMAQW